MARGIHTLAVTTGTSLLTNLRRLAGAGGGFEGWIAGQPGEDRDLLRRERRALEAAVRAVEAGRWADAGQALAALGGTPRVLGAEISSLAFLLGEPAMGGLENVQLIHSDTAEGRGCAVAVQAYLAARERVMATLRAVPDLHHAPASRFRVAGLRNLVSILARAYRESGGALAVDATGGYKAQIALAVLFGQAFQVPVFYRFEAFEAPMEFPPLPVRFDDGIVEEFLPLFERETVTASFLENLAGAPLGEENPRFARVRMLLEGPAEGEGGEPVWTVSPFGTLLHERWLSRTRD